MKSISLIVLFSALLSLPAFGQSQKSLDLLSKGIMTDNKGMIDEALSKKVSLTDALNEAIRLEKLDYVKHFVEKGADPSASLTLAVKVGNIEIVRYLFEKGAKLTDFRDYEIVGQASYGKLPIFSKRIRGKHYWVKEDGSKLVHVGEEFSYQTQPVYTANKAIIYAIDNNDLEMIELLLQNGADLQKLCSVTSFSGVNITTAKTNIEPTPPFIMLPVEYAVMKNVNTPTLESLLKHEPGSKSKYAYEIGKVDCLYENSCDSILTLNTDTYGFTISKNRRNDDIFGVKLFVSFDNQDFTEIKFLGFSSDSNDASQYVPEQITRYFYNIFGDSVRPGDLYFRVSLNQYDEFVDPRDGEIYKTVKIGDQVVMAENFRYKPEDGYWGLKSKDPEVLRNYGYSYMFSTANESAPPGWHVPSMDEWKSLYEYVEGNIEYYSALAVLQKGGGTGFNLVQAGTHSMLGFTEVGLGDFFWSSEPGCFVMLFSYFNGFQIPWVEQFVCVREDTKVGLSVRLFKDK